ncbi:hypothetical protein [Paraburkholderia sp. RL17-337-BIB-A]|uniref:hypothetical protein n=1 Tax=Paraburkholderia sp. RL17-337-BIB-A TaxID=3031636 RepID=UPI0038B93A74
MRWAGAVGFASAQRPTNSPAVACGWETHAPGVPGVPSVPNVPGVLGAPGAPGVLGVLAVPSVLNAPSAPGVPRVLDVPSVCDVPLGARSAAGTDDCFVTRGECARARIPDAPLWFAARGTRLALAV